MNYDELNKCIVNCRKCKRLVDYRNTREIPARYSGEEYWNKPITGYGDINGKILVIGLAPAFNGGNRTGRIFTGDHSSDFLISSLYEVGLTSIPTSENRNDGLKYNDMYITLALKCAPPDNKPLNVELNNCSSYMHQEIDQMKNVRAIICLGKIAFDAVIKYYKSRGTNTKNIKFGHGVYYDISGIRLYGCYHPSPRNVNTGLLKKDDFISLFRSVREYAES
ncbi:MAG: uracil-DNA glycosylase [Ferroplasma sp.]|uniref:uracil-DNA glycosylase n=1 Tax=Ferroplasma sp. TaxID=2591003 RepID=UPI0028157F26|nr:uracil-DNA glycosylase [Ferroplasma sp.]WMT52227.1 MAG: uracil-DNA glycosylase [Ferroplasma sp.]